MIERKKIFVVGNSRSGTSMMGLILGGHTDIFTFHELHFFEELWDPNNDPNILTYDEALRMTARLFTIQRDGYFNQKTYKVYVNEAKKIVDSFPDVLSPPSLFARYLDYEVNRYGKSISCDQTPRNIFYLNEILAMYSDAYIINMIRDPRDIVLSQKKKWRRRSLGMGDIPRREMYRAWSNYHPITISLLWNAAIREGDVLMNHPRVLPIYFERFVQNPEKWAREICQFIGIAYQSKMLLVPQTGSSHGMDDPDKKGINSEIANRWQQDSKNKNDLYLCQKITWKYMERHGYTLTKISPDVYVIIWIIILWPFKTILAFLLNIQRVRNILVTLKKRLGLNPGKNYTH